MTGSLRAEPGRISSARAATDAALRQAHGGKLARDDPIRINPPSG